MPSYIRALLLLVISGNVLSAFAQDMTTTRSGFAVITVSSGNIAGLAATETLVNRTGSGIEQTIVGPAPLITSGSIMVPPSSGELTTTQIVIANPSVASGGINLFLTNESGIVVSNTVLTLGPHAQIVATLDSLFEGQAPDSSTPLLMTLSSEIPVAINAFSFRLNDFAAIPLSSLSAVTPVPVQPDPTAPSSPSAVPGFGLGLPPMTPTVPVFLPPVTITGGIPPVTFGGGAALIFAQVISGGGWMTEIALGNTSSGFQTLRIDFFLDGLNVVTLTDIVIAPRGVFFLSTDPFLADQFQQ